MKKLVLVLLAILSLTSCSNDDIIEDDFVVVMFSSKLEYFNYDDYLDGQVDGQSVYLFKPEHHPLIVFDENINYYYGVVDSYISVGYGGQIYKTLVKIRVSDLRTRELTRLRSLGLDL
jgi:hypothetical protein